jgi:hypothetical protein
MGQEAEILRLMAVIIAEANYHSKTFICGGFHYIFVRLVCYLLLLFTGRITDIQD